MQSGKIDLDEYFPSGNRANIIKSRIRDEIQQGTLQSSDRVAYLDDIRDLKNEGKKRHRTTVILGILGILTTIIVAIIIYFL
jgi:hypothetical protein